MKKILLTGLVTLSLVVGANASDKDSTINIYGVGAKTDENQNSSYGVGLMFDSEAYKINVETTTDFFKYGTVLKFNPITDSWYIKVGANYLNQKIYAPDNTNSRVSQYSGGLATGYLFKDDLYAEIGGSISLLDGSKIGTDYELIDETNSLVYAEVAKRWFNVLDTTVNVGEVFHEYADDEFSYGLGVDYYPTNNSLLGYKYQNEKDNITSAYSVQYSYVFAEYLDNISNDSYQVNIGLKVRFTDLFDINTYSAPKNIKPHLSELHRFEDVSFGKNMNIQSSRGVQKTAEAIARDTEEIVTPPTTPISTPTISLADQTVNDNSGAVSTNLPSPTVTNVNSGAVYSIVGNPTGGMLTINATTGIMTWNGDLSAQTDYSITIKVSNTDTGNNSSTFNLRVRNI